jgi:hypothetical protein
MIEYLTSNPFLRLVMKDIIPKQGIWCNEWIYLFIFHVAVNKKSFFSWTLAGMTKYTLNYKMKD